MASGVGLPENVVDWILALGFRAEHQRLAETSLFHLMRGDTVPVDVVDPLLRPDELLDFYPRILSFQPPSAKRADQAQEKVRREPPSL